MANELKEQGNKAYNEKNYDEVRKSFGADPNRSFWIYIIQ
jgi:hypothetical protein